VYDDISVQNVSTLGSYRMSLPTSKHPLIKQPNLLTTAAYSLDRNQKRLIYMALSNIIKNENITKEPSKVVVTIPHGEYSSTFNCDNTSRDIRSSLDSFENNKSNSKGIVFYIPDEDGDDGEKALEKLYWITGYKHLPRSRTTQVYFNPDVINILERTDKKFTQYLLSVTAKLDNAYAMRLYESICQWRSTRTSYSHEIQWMLDRFTMPKSYTLMSNFRNKFLIPAVNEISQKTDIELSFEEECKGCRRNTVTHIRFLWTEKEDKKPKAHLRIALTLEDAIQTYSDLSNNTRLPSQIDIDNLKQHIGQLGMEGFALTPEFFAQLKAAETANALSSDG